MSRKWTLKTKSYRDLQFGIPYPVRVLEVSRTEGADLFRVAIEHTSREQDGRFQDVVLPNEVLPNNSTARFLRAVGIPVEADTTVNPEDAVGRQLRVAFSCAAEGQDPQPVSFAPMEKEEANGSDE